MREVSDGHRIGMEFDGGWFLLFGFDFLLLSSEFFEPHGFAIFACENISGDFFIGKRCCRRGERAGFEEAGGGVHGKMCSGQGDEPFVYSDELLYLWKDPMGWIGQLG